VAQADLGNFRGSLGTGVSDVRRDLSKLLRDARKMGKATRAGLERLQKDMVATARGRRCVRPDGHDIERATTYIPRSIC
jgi:hypothetical protein